jgi:hypothetical protein
MRGKFLLTSAIAMLFVALFLPYSAFAKSTVYKTGYAKFDTYFETGTFYLPKGEVKYSDKSKRCKKDEWFEVEIRNGNKIHTSVYFRCTPKTIWHSYTFTMKKAGNYHLRFVNTAGGTKHLTNYKLFK